MLATGGRGATAAGEDLPALKVLNPAAPALPAWPLVFTAGSEARIEVALETPPCQSLRGVLVQKAHALAAPLEEINLGTCPASSTAIAFTAPNVRRTTTLRWEVAACADACEALGAVDVVVVPENLLDDVVLWSGEHVIYLHDRQGLLADFLDRSGIEWQTNTRGIDDEAQVVSLVVVDDGQPLPELPARVGGRVLLFKGPDSDAIAPLPAVTFAGAAAQQRISVNLPLLPRDAADDARFSLWFLPWFNALTGNAAAP